MARRAGQLVVAVDGIAVEAEIAEGVGAAQGQAVALRASSVARRRQSNRYRAPTALMDGAVGVQCQRGRRPGADELDLVAQPGAVDRPSKRRSPMRAAGAHFERRCSAAPSSRVSSPATTSGVTSESVGGFRAPGEVGEELRGRRGSPRGSPMRGFTHCQRRCRYRPAARPYRSAAGRGWRDRPHPPAARR